MIKYGITGAKEIIDNLKELDKKTARAALVKAVFDAAEPVRAEVESRAPVDTGFLKAGVIKKTLRRGARFVVVGVGVGKKRGNKNARGWDVAWYWRLIELGTSKMAARPFVAPSLPAKKDAAINIFKIRIWERIRRAVKAK